MKITAKEMKQILNNNSMYIETLGSTYKLKKNNIVKMTETYVEFYSEMLGYEEIVKFEEIRDFEII